MSEKLPDPLRGQELRKNANASQTTIYLTLADEVIYPHLDPSQASKLTASNPSLVNFLVQNYQVGQDPFPHLQTVQRIQPLLVGNSLTYDNRRSELIGVEPLHREHVITVLFDYKPSRLSPVVIAGDAPKFREGDDWRSYTYQVGYDPLANPETAYEIQLVLPVMTSFPEESIFWTALTDSLASEAGQYSPENYVGRTLEAVMPGLQNHIASMTIWEYIIKELASKKLAGRPEVEQFETFAIDHLRSLQTKAVEWVHKDFLSAYLEQIVRSN